jgi:WD40 repeat protein
VDRDRALQAEAAATEERDRARRAELTAAEQRNLAINAQQQALAAGETANAERDRANAERDRGLSMQQRADEERSRAQSAEDQARHEATAASNQRRIAASQQLVSRALRPEMAHEDYDLASLLVVQAFRINPRMPVQSRQSIEEALQKAAMWTPTHSLGTRGSRAYAAVALSADATQLAAGGDDQIVRVWNIRTPSQAPLLLDQRGSETDGIRALEFSDDGRLLAVGLVGANPNTTTIGTIHVWNLKSAGSPPLILRGGGHIESLVFLPNGEQLVSSATGPVGIEASYVVLWNLLNPKSRQILVRQNSTVNTMPSGRVSLSPNGTRVAVALATDVRVWDLRNPSRELFSLKPPPLASGQSNPVYSVAFSPDGVHLAIGSTGIHIWDLRNLQSPPVTLKMPFEATENIYLRMLRYSKEGNRIAAPIGSTTYIWDLSTPATRPEGYVAGATVTGLAYSANGGRLAVATLNGVKLWDFSGGGQPLLTPRIPREYSRPNIGQFDYSADLTRVFDAIDEVPSLWDLRRSPPRSTPLEGERGTIPYKGGVFCKNDTRLLQAASLSNSSFRLIVWDLGTANSAPVLLRSREFRGPLRRVFACSADGARAAVHVSGGNSQTGLQIVDLEIVDLERSDMPSLLTLRGVAASSALAFSPDRKILAVGKSQSVDLWDLADPRFPIRSLPLSGQPSTVIFSPDGNRLGSSGLLNGGPGVMWEIHNATALLRFPSSPNSGLAFAPDGTRFATSDSSTVRVWDQEKPGSQPVELQFPGSFVNALVFSSDGLRLRAGDMYGAVAEWNLESGAADLLCSRIWRNLSMGEWETHVGEGIPYERTCPNLPAGTGVPGGPK